jgi:hypothetical protein
MSGSHEPLPTGEVDDQLADPHSAVGDYVRRRDDGTPQRTTQWAQIAMTVPSASGLCWMVCFIDGEVDIWRVDDASARYEFRSQDRRPAKGDSA